MLCFLYGNKNTSLTGIKEGYSEQLKREEKGIREVSKIRSNCRNYKRILRDAKGEAVQIEGYRNGKADCLFQAHRKGNACCYLPYSPDGGYYPAYSYVTIKKDGRIVEEYMVNGNQVIYERYFGETNLKAEYYYINYVHEGRYPVLEEEKGIFRFHPLRYECLERDDWTNHRRLNGGEE